MASVKQTKAIGGVTPLGVITINTATPVQIIAGLGLTGKTYALTARQLGFSVSAASTGEVYVQYGNFSGIDANATVLIVQHGTSAALPADLCSDGVLDVTQYYISGSVNGDKVAIYAADASS